MIPFSAVFPSHGSHPVTGSTILSIESRVLKYMMEYMKTSDRTEATMEYHVEGVVFFWFPQMSHEIFTNLLRRKKGVSIVMGVPHWIDGIYKGKSQTKMDDDWGVPPLMETPKSAVKPSQTKPRGIDSRWGTGHEGPDHHSNHSTWSTCDVEMMWKWCGNRQWKSTVPIVPICSNHRFRV